MRAGIFNKRLWGSLVVLVAACMVLSAHARAANIAQGYVTNDKDLKVSMIAGLSSESTPDRQIVERATKAKAGQMVGVVTTIDSSLLTLTSTGAQVHVATSGEIAVYVSDLNGDIKKGDWVAPSPLQGVGMKFGDDDNTVVGTALEDFSSDQTQSQDVQTTDGGHKSVKVGQLKVDVEPKYGVQNTSSKKPYLVLFGQSLTGKSVTQTQVIVALLIFFIILVVEGSIIYGATYSSINSLGRNPLAKRAIFRQLLQVGGLALLVLAFGLASLYAVLWI